MDKDVEVVQDGRPGGDDAIPETAQVRCRLAVTGQRVLHRVDERSQVVLFAVVGDRPLQRLEERRLTLSVFLEGIFKGRRPGREESAPGIRRAEVSDPGQDLALDVELELLLLAVELVVASGGVVVPDDGGGQAPLHTVDECFQGVVIAVD